MLHPALLTVLISVRLTRMTIHILGAFALAPVYPMLSRSAQRRIMQWWSAGLLQVLNVHHNASGQPPQKGAPTCLLVANHISWLDIFAVNVLTPAFFVAKAEVKEWAVLGWLVQRSGTLFIRRNHRSDVVRINQHMAELLHQGSPVALFPQGTSALPDQPLQFHAPLLQSAVVAAAPVQPICIFYHDRQGNPHPAPAFIGDTSFIRSVWRIVGIADIRVLECYLPPLAASGQDRRALALMAQQVVTAALAERLPARQFQRHQSATKLPQTRHQALPT